MRFISTISDLESTAAAADEIASAVSAVKNCDAAFVFFTAHHRDEANHLLEKLQSALNPRMIIGCSAEGVIGADREIERSPGVALFAGEMPGVKLSPFHIPMQKWRELLNDDAAMSESFACDKNTRAILGFGDPFTTPMHRLLPTLDRIAPWAPLVGGMASSARQPGENALLLNGDILEDGMVGVSLSGEIEVETVVSQGCRPIGVPMLVTRSKENVIQQLGGKPPVEVLRDLISSLPEGDRHLLRHGLLIGQAISEYRETFTRGDFLVRNVIGVDEEENSVSVNDFVKVGQTVQFHVRDAHSADEDLASMLLSQENKRSAAGALLFSCNGRGSRMFDQANHDIAAAHEKMPATPVAGFFAAGEIGPIGGRNFMHGHTASFALLRSGGKS